ncbi:MAG: SdrD B-like domain-containing protein, partial [Bacteroidota bacterium]
VPASRSVRVRYNLPNGDWKFTTKQGPITQGNNSDAGNDGRTGTFSADRGSDLNEFVDAGMWRPGTLTTLVWDDIDNIGTLSGFERDNEGVENILVELLESNGNPVTNPENNDMPVTAMTDENGLATLGYVPASRSVRVRYNLPNGDWKFTTKQGPISQGNNSDAGNDGRTGTFSADRGSDLIEFVDAGMWSPGQVVAYVWEDANGNGTQNGSETGIFGMQVNLLESNGSPVLRPNGTPVTAITECGTYEATLDYVPASRSVRVEFVPFDGGVFTTKQGPITQGNNSDASPGNGRTGTFSANRGSQTYTFVDAGFTDRGDFGDGNIIARVWNDIDGDGKQDNSENNDDLEGIKVNLIDTDGNICVCDETDADGLAQLAGFSGDNYQLRFELPADHYFTPQDVTTNGTNDNNDSDARQTAGNPDNIGKTSTFSLSPGQTITNLDAGMWVPGTVLARAWNDVDGDGKQDNSENGDDVAGVDVTVTETDGTPLINPNNNQVVTGTTDVNGEVSLYVPADRSFQLKFDLNDDYAFTPEDVTTNGTNENNDSDARQTAGNAANIGRTDSYRANRGSQLFTEIDAGYWLPGTVTARAWNDVDGDGKQDNSENNDDLEGIQVTVTEANGTPLIDPNTNMMVTGATGMNGEVTLYVPANRAFQLKFDLPADHAFTSQDVTTNGTNDNNDSDAVQTAGNAANIGRTASYQADRGSQSFTQIDAGLWVPGTVTARAWNDVDGDGKQDNSENGDDVSGITVTVTEANGSPLVPPNNELVSSVTGSNGEVTLYVPADRPFQLKFDLPVDHAFTPEDVTTNGTNDGNDSDARSSAGNVANIGRTDSYQADRGSQEFTQIDAGLWLPGTVVARAWVDVDGDGKQDNSENNEDLKGVVVEVLEANGTPLLLNQVAVQDVTNADGEVELYVPADRPFQLRFGSSDGYDYTLDNVTTNGTNDNNDSDARDEAGNPDNLGKTENYQADRGSQVFTQIDAGYIEINFLREAEEDAFVDVDGIANDDQRGLTDLNGGGDRPAEVQMETFDDLTLFPVPARDRLNVMVRLAASQSVDYAIIDATGRSLRVERVELAEGQNQLDLDVRNLPAGQYYLQLRTASELKTKVFTVIR